MAYHIIHVRNENAVHVDCDVNRVILGTRPGFARMLYLTTEKCGAASRSDHTVL